MLSPKFVVNGTPLNNQESEVMKGGKILVPPLWHTGASLSLFPENELSVIKECLGSKLRK